MNSAAVAASFLAESPPSAVIGVALRFVAEACYGLHPHPGGGCR